MKYCQSCGNKLDDDALFCQNCGAKNGTEQNKTLNETSSGNQADTLGLIAFVFMILATIAMGFALFPLIWCIPMTIYLNGKLKSGEPIGIGFKVCTLLFVSLIAGILLLCRQENE